MKPFPEMWEAAKSLGADLDQLAEDVYDSLVKRNADEASVELILNVLAEVRNLFIFLQDEKVAVVELNRLKQLLKEHKHTDGQTVLPME